MSSISDVAFQRLRKDASRLARDPVPFIAAVPLASNILEWHYVVQGPPDSLYAGGIYHGKLVFTKEYPFKPPAIYMLTPNGRFQVNTRLCLSISDFHPDTWNPAWSVGTILTGLLSFMLETTPTLGSIETSDYEKRQLAQASGPQNLRNKTFRDLFPELCREIQNGIDERIQLEKRLAAAKADALKSRNEASASNEKIASESKRANVDDEEGEIAAAFRPNAQNNLANFKNKNTNGIGLMNASAISNLLVFVGVVAFVFVAKCVLQSAE